MADGGTRPPPPAGAAPPGWDEGGWVEKALGGAMPKEPLPEELVQDERDPYAVQGDWEEVQRQRAIADARRAERQRRRKQRKGHADAAPAPPATTTAPPDPPGGMFLRNAEGGRRRILHMEEDRQRQSIAAWMREAAPARAAAAKPARVVPLTGHPLSPIAYPPPPAARSPLVPLGRAATPSTPALSSPTVSQASTDVLSRAGTPATDGGAARARSPPRPPTREMEVQTVLTRESLSRQAARRAQAEEREEAKRAPADDPPHPSVPAPAPPADTAPAAPGSRFGTPSRDVRTLSTGAYAETTAPPPGYEPPPREAEPEAPPPPAVAEAVDNDVAEPEKKEDEAPAPAAEVDAPPVPSASAGLELKNPRAQGQPEPGRPPVEEGAAAAAARGPPGVLDGVSEVSPLIYERPLMYTRHMEGYKRPFMARHRAMIEFKDQPGGDWEKASMRRRERRVLEAKEANARIKVVLYAKYDWNDLVQAHKSVLDRQQRARDVEAMIEKKHVKLITRTMVVGGLIEKRHARLRREFEEEETSARNMLEAEEVLVATRLHLRVLHLNETFEAGIADDNPIAVERDARLARENLADAEFADWAALRQLAAVDFAAAAQRQDSRERILYYQTLDLVDQERDEREIIFIIEGRARADPYDEDGSSMYAKRLFFILSNTGCQPVCAAAFFLP
eukprot:TRINITY_DN11692_c0_g1_i3.p1 TRINITY_DN11692_c0_g1~~TRINITY_DN11692_c0_g1_i3.p1  ORF type:complete len:678 (+),score=231.55 TRINITY_DN11692_c0_g1_i3:83-2116(+)